LQKKQNYPKNPVITDEITFTDFIKMNGPEIAQSGGLNFSHTVAANGFSKYYQYNFIQNVTPIDEVVEFYVCKL